MNVDGKKKKKNWMKKKGNYSLSYFHVFWSYVNHLCVQLSCCHISGKLNLKKKNRNKNKNKIKKKGTNINTGEKWQKYFNVVIILFDQFSMENHIIKVTATAHCEPYTHLHFICNVKCFRTYPIYTFQCFLFATDKPREIHESRWLLNLIHLTNVIVSAMNVQKVQS